MEHERSASESGDQRSDAAGAVKANVAKLSKLEKRKTELEQRPLVYAGTFTKPEKIHLLNRGEERVEIEVGDDHARVTPMMMPPVTISTPPAIT